MPAHALLNGEPAPEAAFHDRACQFGDGLFETLAVRDGEPCLWKLHLARLQEGCARLDIPPPDPGLLLREAHALCSDRDRAVLKIIVSAGENRRGYARSAASVPTRWVYCGDWPEGDIWTRREWALQLQECSIRLGTQPLLAGIKHLNRLEQVLARRELRSGIHEGLMRDQQGHVTEGISSNLLLMLEDCYRTPPIDQCGVAGTVRQLLIDSAQLLDLPLQVARVDRRTLLGARAVFMMNSLMGVRPVRGLEAHVYPTSARPAGLDRLHRACFTFSGDTQCNV
jgi:4-amino-4-deoxychorismate lyase